MNPAASAVQAEKLADWQDYGQAREREAAEACALSMNESPSRISWEYRVFPVGAKWVVRRRVRP